MTASLRCREQILLALYENSLGFEDLVGKVDYSRGTVNRQLRELYGFEVEQESGRGHRKYFLTDMGRLEAGKLFLKDKVNEFIAEKSIPEMKIILRDIKRIIEEALKVPDEEFGAFFSCMGQFETVITGIYKPFQDMNNKSNK